MDVKIAKLQPTEKNNSVFRGIVDIALKEILQGIIIHDWNLFKDMSGMEIIQDKKLLTFMPKLL